MLKCVFQITFNHNAILARSNHFLFGFTKSCILKSAQFLKNMTVNKTATKIQKVMDFTLLVIKL